MPNEATNIEIATRANLEVKAQLANVSTLASRVASKAARGKLDELAAPLADLLTAGATLVAYQQILQDLDKADV